MKAELKRLQECAKDNAAKKEQVKIWQFDWLPFKSCIGILCLHFKLLKFFFDETFFKLFDWLPFKTSMSAFSAIEILFWWNIFQTILMFTLKKINLLKLLCLPFQLLAQIKILQATAARGGKVNVVDIGISNPGQVQTGFRFRQQVYKVWNFKSGPSSQVYKVWKLTARPNSLRQNWDLRQQFINVGIWN